MTVYLSPFNQTRSFFVLGGYNESQYTRKLCMAIKRFLSAQSELVCLVAAENHSLQNRPEAAKINGCELYIAVRTGCSHDSRAKGTICYYHPNSDKSFELAVQIVESLTSLCPIASADEEPIVDGTRIYNTLSLTEIQLPHELGMTPVLIEVNAHDNPKTCLWLINSINEIAGTIAGCLKAFANTK